MNRNALVNHGTVFGAWGLGRSIAIVGALLVITFVVIEPEASRGLGVAARTVFWVIHVGLGLVSLYAASWLVLPHMMNSLPAWLVLLVAGTGGALLVTPLSYLVEQVLPASLRALEDEDEWLNVFASRGWWQAIAGEFLQRAPATLASCRRRAGTGLERGLDQRGPRRRECTGQLRGEARCVLGARRRHAAPRLAQHAVAAGAGQLGPPGRDDRRAGNHVGEEVAR